MGDSFELIKYIDRISKFIPDAREIRIATYGLYSGFIKNDEYVDVNNSASKLLKLFPDNTSIIVGFPELWPCKEGCIDCIEKYKQTMNRINLTMEQFPRFNWFKTSQFHAKWYLLKYGTGIIGYTGGHNLTGSGWFDISVRMSVKAAEIAWDLHSEKMYEIDQANRETCDEWEVQEDK